MFCKYLYWKWLRACQFFVRFFFLDPTKSGISIDPNWLKIIHFKVPWKSTKRGCLGQRWLKISRFFKGCLRSKSGASIQSWRNIGGFWNIAWGEFSGAQLQPGAPSLVLHGIVCNCNWIVVYETAWYSSQLQHPQDKSEPLAATDCQNFELLPNSHFGAARNRGHKICLCKLWLPALFLDPLLLAGRKISWLDIWFFCFTLMPFSRFVEVFTCQVFLDLVSLASPRAVHDFQASASDDQRHHSMAPNLNRGL